MAQSIEYIIIVAIIFWQLLVFFGTNRRQTRRLRGLFPAVEDVALISPKVRLSEDGSILEEDIKRLTSSEMNDFSWLERGSDVPDEAPDTRVPVTLVKPVAEAHEVFGRILHATNLYLLRNKDRAVKFEIIRDITDRETEAFQGEVESSLQLPLYLGLLGTIAGIVAGLFGLAGGTVQRSGDVQAIFDAIEPEIPGLLWGVAFAMVASGTGLLLTVIATNFWYKKALSVCDRNRNAYLTYLQTGLFHDLGTDMDSSLKTFQGLMESFNRGFKDNLVRFTGALDDVQKNMETQRTALVEQKAFLDSFQKSKDTILSIVKSNAQVFTAINRSAQQFERFSQYQTQLQETGTKIEQSFNGISGLFDRFGSFEQHVEEVATGLQGAFQRQSSMIDYLEKQLSEMQNRETLFTRQLTQADAAYEDRKQAFARHMEEIDLARAEREQAIVDHMDELATLLNKKFIELDNKYQLSIEHLQQEAVGHLQAYRNLVLQEQDYIHKTYENSKPDWRQLARLGDIQQAIEKLVKGEQQLPGAQLAHLERIRQAIDQLITGESRPPWEQLSHLQDIRQLLTQHLGSNENGSPWEPLAHLPEIHQLLSQISGGEVGPKWEELGRLAGIEQALRDLNRKAVERESDSQGLLLQRLETVAQELSQVLTALQKPANSPKASTASRKGPWRWFTFLFKRST